MYRVEYLGRLEKEKDLNEVFELLCACDQDFVPPLSQRESTFQKGFSGDRAEVKPYTYFETMKEQLFLCAWDESDRIVAFLTFRHNYTCKELAAFGPSNYMTTAGVYPECRGYGLIKRMYEIVESELPEELRTKYTTTRTWSTNIVQINAFPKRGYEVAAVLKDDRGPGVDTIYYYKRNPA